MPTLVLTVVGDDRAGLVAAVAEVVDAHGGNWERSQLAELAGTFAGVIEVSVAADHESALRAALVSVEGLMTVAVPAKEQGADASTTFPMSFTVLGNDRPGIVREIAGALSAHGVSIDRLTTETRDAAMAGGRLFEATVIARAPASVDLAAVTDELERLASEIQVDVTVGE